MAYYLLIFFAIFSCSQHRTDTKKEPETEHISYKYLALGDSYTIGHSVCETCSYPEQLKDSVNTNIVISGEVTIIAKTGWTTTNLLDAINQASPANDYDLVSLLIGVNNQFQNKPFSIYEEDFPKLLTNAIAFAGGDVNKVLVISIPDYAFTPFGQNNSNQQQISQEIDRYNAYAKQISEDKGVYFQNITDITRMGLEDPELVAEDGLHPSEIAYKKFVERLYGKAFDAINN